MNNKYPLQLILGLTIFTLLFILRDIFLLSIPGYAISVWFVALVSILPFPTALIAVFFMLPFACGFPGYTILFTLIALLLKTPNINAWQIIPTIIIAILEIWKVAFYQFDIIFNSVISYIGFIALFFYLLCNQDVRPYIKSCITYFCLGTILTLVIVYIPIITNHGFLALIAGEARGGLAMGFEEISESKGHLVMNANTIAYYSIILFATSLLGSKRLGMDSWMIYLGVTISVVAGALSFSRTWLLLTLIIALLHTIHARHKIITIISIVVVSVAIFTSQNYIISSISEVFQTRLEDDTMDTGGNRSVLFKDYNEIWMTDMGYIITGTGATHYSDVLNQQESMHNGLQQIWVCHGVVGLLVFISAITHYMSKYRNRKIPIAFYLPLLACFIFNQTIQFLVPYTLMLPFIPSLYALQLNNDSSNYCHQQ